MCKTEVERNGKTEGWSIYKNGTSKNGRKYKKEINKIITEQSYNDENMEEEWNNIKFVIEEAARGAINCKNGKIKIKWYNGKWIKCLRTRKQEYSEEY